MPCTSVTAELDLQLHGRSEPVTESPEGKVVIGRPNIRDGLKTGVIGAPTTGSRRSVYVEVQRRLPFRHAGNL